MKHSEIYKEEHESDRDYAVVTLYRESGWWRAYEWSAYLVTFFNKELESNKRLKPNKRYEKSCKDDIINIGMPEKSFEKFLPGIVPVISDDVAKFTVEISTYDLGENLKYNEILKEWKGNTPYKEDKKSGNDKKYSNGNEFINNPVTFTYIMKKILCYQVETKSNEENISFIFDLKNLCASMI